MSESIEEVLGKRVAIRFEAKIRFQAATCALAVLLGTTGCQHGAGAPAEPSQSPTAPASAPPEPTTPLATASAEQETPRTAPETAPSAAAGPAPSSAPEPVSSSLPIAPAAPGPGRTIKGVTPKPAAPPAPTPAAVASAAPPVDTASADACATRSFHYTQVASACHTGGRKAAKEFMKGAVRKAKAAGADLKCTSCHEDMTSFHLKGNAVSDLKQWL